MGGRGSSASQRGLVNGQEHVSPVALPPCLRIVSKTGTHASNDNDTHRKASPLQATRLQPTPVVHSPQRPWRHIMDLQNEAVPRSPIHQADWEIKRSRKSEAWSIANSSKIAICFEYSWRLIVPTLTATATQLFLLRSPHQSPAGLRIRPPLLTSSYPKIMIPFFTPPGDFGPRSSVGVFNGARNLTIEHWDVIIPSGNATTTTEAHSHNHSHTLVTHIHVHLPSSQVTPSEPPPANAPVPSLSSSNSSIAIPNSTPTFNIIIVLPLCLESRRGATKCAPHVGNTVLSKKLVSPAARPSPPVIRGHLHEGGDSAAMTLYNSQRHYSAKSIPMISLLSPPTPFPTPRQKLIRL
ncbi:hypothetical protein NMY22_g7588 [Coprinellus aureogranulatus]|nr:hypothetical protein NMY22_g7588 [Coprinellus aureogranulatus]